MLDSLKPIVALSKRRGFIYPGSELYGGFANTYSYGPYGVELTRIIKNLWWKFFVQERRDIKGIDGPILLHPMVWEASGHLAGFNDAMIDCKSCKSRFRADHLIQKLLNVDVEGLDIEALNLLIKDNDIACPKCKKKDFTSARYFNLMFPVNMSKTDEKDNVTYLRPETAQSIFLEYKNVIDTMRVKLPFGIAQIGKAFRNEITPGNSVFRTIEFEQMEIEYFIREETWKQQFETWLSLMHQWCDLIGLKKENLGTEEHKQEKLSHYSKRTVDIVYDFPFGRSELYGLAYRTDFDLSQHMNLSKTNLEYIDQEHNKRFIPHVIEPTFGVGRTLLALLCDSYEEEKLPNDEIRTVLHLAPHIAPVKTAIFPLMKKPDLVNVAIKLFDALKSHFNVEYDEAGAIGKRYRRQDELGTPYCLTIDYQTLEDQTVTLRDRDSMEQKRIPLNQVINTLKSYLKDSSI